MVCRVLWVWPVVTVANHAHRTDSDRETQRKIRRNFPVESGLALRLLRSFFDGTRRIAYITYRGIHWQPEEHAFTRP